MATGNRIQVAIEIDDTGSANKVTRAVVTDQRVMGIAVVTGPKGDNASGGTSFPPGGLAGDYVVKNSSMAGDVAWTSTLSPNALYTDTIATKSGDGQIDINAFINVAGILLNGNPVDLSIGVMSTLQVAASNATITEKAFADYQCDGTADDVEIQQALNNAFIVRLSSGDFTTAAPLYVEGDDTTEAKNKALWGAGSEATFIRPASGVHGIVLRKIPKPDIRDLQVVLQGASDGMRATAPTSGSTDRRGFWQGFFKNVYLKGDFATHTGWAINMENPFRSTFINVQGNGIKNGVRFVSTYSNFNPGNCVAVDCHMDLGRPNGTAYLMESAATGGFLNIATFIECDAIDSASGSTTSIGWHFKGSASSYFTTRDMLVLRSNVEQFATAVKFEHAANIEMNLNFVNTKNNGKVAELSSDSTNNVVTAQYIYVPGSTTTEAFIDANTDQLKPNILRHAFARVETGGTLTLTPSSATVIGQLSRDSDGTGVYPTQWQGQTTPLVVQDEGTTLFRGTRKLNFVGAGVTATATGPDITVTIPGGSSSTGDMQKSTYDTNNDGIVDNSAALGGQNSAYHLNRTNHTGTQAVGTITGLGPLATLVPTGTANATTYLRGDGSYSVPATGGNTTTNNFNSFKFDQTPASGSFGTLAGTVNGTNAVFTVSNGSYVSGTLTVYVNGQLQAQGNPYDWTETAPGSGTFTFVTAPPSGSIIGAGYITSVTSSGAVPSGYSIKTANYTMNGTTDRNIYGDTNASAFTITMPDATLFDGFVYDFKNITSGSGTSNLLTVQPVNSQTIDGAPRRTLMIYDAIRVQAVNVAGVGYWYIK